MSGERLTTREATEVLGCGPCEAVPLLRAARVPCSRIGRAYLWDAPTVRSVALRLAQDREVSPATTAPLDDGAAR